MKVVENVTIYKCDFCKKGIEKKTCNGSARRKVLR
jgi:hypothetical protein